MFIHGSRPTYAGYGNATTRYQSVYFIIVKLFVVLATLALGLAAFSNKSYAGNKVEADFSSAHICEVKQAVSKSLDFWVPNMEQIDFACDETVILWSAGASMVHAEGRANLEMNTIVMHEDCLETRRGRLSLPCKNLLKHEVAHLLGANEPAAQAVVARRADRRSGAIAQVEYDFRRDRAAINVAAE